MDKMKRFLDCYISTENCNLRCHYCYVGQRREFNSKLVKFEHSPEFIRKALSKKRLGGTCLINFCAGGETLLSEDVLDVAKALLEEGHYLMIVTNGTPTKRFEQITQWDICLKERLFFKFSYHYLELKRLNLFDVFWNNVRLMRDSGCSFTVELTPNDELIPYIEDVKQRCLDNVGALPHVTIARDETIKEFSVLSSLSWDDYLEIWRSFDSKMFSFKASVFGEKRKEFCYAGDWSGAINLDSGDLMFCTYEKKLFNIYEDLKKSIPFKALGTKCSMAHCYNSHAWLTLGTIPEVIAPTFADIRDRVDREGKHWLQPRFRNFISQKLKDNNKEYSKRKKDKVENPKLTLKQKLSRNKLLRRLLRKK